MFVLLNKFDRDLDEDVRVLGVAETQDELISLIEDLDELEEDESLVGHPAYWVESDPDASGRPGPFTGAPTVFSAGVEGGQGWYEIVRVG